ncbi:type VI secretion system protein [Thalassomonas actiniarum]|uniref:Type VI secretion system component TssM1 N-terminal domain-containing protein n=1 Tax=Thalassomonas actiniarum TaxID=485447 RepID=A0AAF0C1A4_9GAMM|nr:type VI secretion system protein [Thalassomonas actiniarum]WDD96565.1 hypothetical protein SG35_014350 [Thalassomonas actiniarum]
MSWLSEVFSVILAKLDAFPGAVINVFANTEAGSLIEQLKERFNELLAQLSLLALELKQALMDRLLPMVEQLRPIWQDPLWQALALILLAVLALLLVLWLLKSGNQLLQYLFGLLVAGIKKGFAWLLAPFRLLSEWLSKFSKAKRKKSRWQWLHLGQVRRAVNAMKYLTTKRDWRYNMPWFLLIGEQGSGKSALIKAVTKGRRAQLQPREKKLKDPGSGWHFFDHAVVIDQDNKAPGCSAELSDPLEREASSFHEPELSPQQRNKRFSYLIELLHWYRPERPVDGIILTVSAKTLLKCREPATLLALGEDLFQQLWQVQKQTGFVLPVYLIVTQCDGIEGFDAFWQAQPIARRDEMIGWSNPYRLDSAFSKDWINEALHQVMENLQAAQLQVAASGQEIGDIDRFMLFRHNFCALFKPLKAVISSAFARSSFQEALPLRGIYFSGALENKVSFVNDVVNRKIFGEKHLAFPLEQRYFSTQKTLRRFQLGSMAAAVLLTLLLAFDGIRFNLYTDVVQGKLRTLVSAEQDCTREGLDSYRLLSDLTEISERPLLMSMPLSLFNIQAHKEQQLVANDLFKKILFAGLECRLKLKAQTLSLEMEKKALGDTYREVITDITTFSHLLREYQVNRERFLSLAEPVANPHGLGKKFKELLNYLYARPVPEAVDTSASLITGGLVLLNYNVDWDEKNNSLISQDKLLSHLDYLTQALRTELTEYTQQVPLVKLQKISEKIRVLPSDKVLPPSKLVDNINEFQLWLDRTKRDWLSATAFTSPCGNVYQLMGRLRQELVAVGFDKDRLAAMVERFSEKSCDQQVRHKLADLNVPPFGPLFIKNDQGRLSFSPTIEGLAEQIEAAKALAYMKNQYAAVSDAAESVVAWEESTLQELLNNLLSYQEFLSRFSQEQKPFFSNALNRRLQRVTERLLSEAMVRPYEQTPSSYLIADPATATESAIGKSVASFKGVSSLLLQINSLLKQLGDNGNAIRLQQASHTFALEQLEQLEKLVAQNQLYTPVLTPRWDSRDFARILFNLDTDKQITSYLTNQRQRLSYLAYNYAEPLIGFLQNSSGLSDKLAQRWFYTLSDLGRYQRNEPDNQALALENFVSETLAGLTTSNCYDKTAFDNQAPNTGWFVTRRIQLQRQVSVQCLDAGDKEVIDRYLAIRDRFNQQLAGRFPFSSVDKAGIRDVSSKQLQRFFNYYRQASKNLLADMNTLDKLQQDKGDAKPVTESASAASTAKGAKTSDAQAKSDKQTKKRTSTQPLPASWREFISQMNTISDFFSQSWNSKQKQWQVPLTIEFSALPQYAKGSDQIINWLLQSGKQQASFPNGENLLLWQVGEPLSLDLRWATGSAFKPLMPEQSGDLDTRVNPPLMVDQQQFSATFNSQGNWGLFEWLARYTNKGMSGLKASRQDETLLAFQVPVQLKTAPEPGKQTKKQAYLSRSNLLVWVEVTDKQGDAKKLPLPGVLPAHAPGFND